MADLQKTCKTLIKALNVNGANILYNRREFMGVEGIPHTMYSISRAYWDAEKGKYGSRKIYESASLIRVIFYLRDMLFLEQGKPLPMDNVDWNKLRPDDLLTHAYRENTDDDNPNLPDVNLKE